VARGRTRATEPGPPGGVETSRTRPTPGGTPGVASGVRRTQECGRRGHGLTPWTTSYSEQQDRSQELLALGKFKSVRFRRTIDSTCSHTDAHSIDRFLCCSRLELVGGAVSLSSCPLPKPKSKSKHRLDISSPLDKRRRKRQLWALFILQLASQPVSQAPSPGHLTNTVRC